MEIQEKAALHHLSKPSISSQESIKHRSSLNNSLEDVRNEPDHNSNASKSKIHLRSSTLNEATLRSFCQLKPRPQSLTNEQVIFFDLDNTLYSKQTGIAEQMGQRIELFFDQFLGIPKEEAAQLGRQYYLNYGLSIRGLIENFQIDPKKYDAFVDGSLQLDGVVSPDPVLRSLIASMAGRKWIFTNSSITHATRTLKHLQLDDLFEGIVYCDYCEPDFPAKPDRLSYERAMQSAGISGRPDLCYFVDDNVNNVRAALELGWKAAYLDELHDALPEIVTSSQSQVSVGTAASPTDASSLSLASRDIPTINSIHDLPRIFPELFPTCK